MKNSRLIKNFVYNTSYQILILIAPLITTPYISRVLGVTNIGIYQYVQSIAYYFILVGAVGTTLYGQREIAYLQDKPIERSRTFWEIVIFRCLATIFCLLIYWFIFCNEGAYGIIYIIFTIDIIANAFDITWFFMGIEDFKITVIRNALIKISGIISVFIFVKEKDDLAVYSLCISKHLICATTQIILFGSTQSPIK